MLEKVENPCSSAIDRSYGAAKW